MEVGPVSLPLILVQCRVLIRIPFVEEGRKLFVGSCAQHNNGHISGVCTVYRAHLFFVQLAIFVRVQQAGCAQYEVVRDAGKLPEQVGDDLIGIGTY